MKKIDARGKNCPEPVVMTKNAIMEGAERIETLVDNEIAASNVERFLTKNGFNVERERTGDIIALKGVRTGEKPEDEPCKCGYVVMIAHSVIGGDDKELGEVLMKAYLGALSQGATPDAVILMNEGVKLALPDTSTCEHLQKLASLEVEILVCGTCVKHFGFEPGVGRISNMFEISERLAGAGHVVGF